MPTRPRQWVKNGNIISIRLWVEKMKKKYPGNIHIYKCVFMEDMWRIKWRKIKAMKAWSGDHIWKLGEWCGIENKKKMEWADNAGLDNVKWLTRDSNAIFFHSYLCQTANEPKNVIKNRPSTKCSIISAPVFALNFYTTFFAISLRVEKQFIEIDIIFYYYFYYCCCAKFMLNEMVKKWKV